MCVINAFYICAIAPEVIALYSYIWAISPIAPKVACHAFTSPVQQMRALTSRKHVNSPSQPTALTRFRWSIHPPIYYRPPGHYCNPPPLQASSSPFLPLPPLQAFSSPLLPSRPFLHSPHFIHQPASTYPFSSSPGRDMWMAYVTRGDSTFFCTWEYRKCTSVHLTLRCSDSNALCDRVQRTLICIESYRDPPHSNKLVIFGQGKYGRSLQLQRWLTYLTKSIPCPTCVYFIVSYALKSSSGSSGW